MAGGGSTDKLNDPRLMGKLNKLWAESAKTEKNDSVEMMKARNAAIRLAKNRKPRREDDNGQVAPGVPEKGGDGE